MAAVPKNEESTLSRRVFADSHYSNFENGARLRPFVLYRSESEASFNYTQHGVATLSALPIIERIKI